MIDKLTKKATNKEQRSEKRRLKYFNVMKKELNTYDYYYEPNTQPAMMVANGHAGFHTVHPFNLEDEFLHILGKNRINYTNFNYSS